MKSFLRPVSVEKMGRTRRNSGIAYGVMVIDMGVHELAGLEEPLNLTQVRRLCHTSLIADTAMQDTCCMLCELLHLS